MCSCQTYGKSGVPNGASDRCLVCGGAVDYGLPWINGCRCYRPDANGECLDCDETAMDHSEEAITAGEHAAPAAGEPEDEG